MRERRRWRRWPVGGTAAILELGFTDSIYELEDLSFGGARLHGARPPPSASFALLLRLSSGFVDLRAHVVREADGGAGNASWGIAFDHLAVGAAQAMDRALRRARRG